MRDEVPVHAVVGGPLVGDDDRLGVDPTSSAHCLTNSLSEYHDSEPVPRVGPLRSTAGIFAALFHVAALPLEPAAEGYRTNDDHDKRNSDNEVGHACIILQDVLAGKGYM